MIFKFTGYSSIISVPVIKAAPIIKTVAVAPIIRRPILQTVPVSSYSLALGGYGGLGYGGYGLGYGGYGLGKLGHGLGLGYGLGYGYGKLGWVIRVYKSSDGETLATLLVNVLNKMFTVI